MASNYRSVSQHPSPLAGMRVLELASVLAGPSTGQFLAELGADVIKVENKRTRGDVTRGWTLPQERSSSSPSAYFQCCNAGKRSIALDASVAAGRDLCRRLAQESDVVVASYKPGDAEKFGLDSETLRSVSPKLVYAQITGYGLDDARVGYDALIQAESGFTYINGEPGVNGRPTKMPVALVDVLAAHQLKEAILLALWRRDRTGVGSHVHVSLMGAAVASLANQATGYLCAGVVPQRMGSEHPAIVPYGTAFDDKDGQQLILAVGSDSQFRSLCDVLGCPEIASDARFSNNAARVLHRDELKPLLAKKVAMMFRSDVLSSLKQKNVPAGAVADMAAVFATPQAQAMTIKDPTGEMAGLRQVAWGGDGAACDTHKKAPRYGEHTEEILTSVLGIQASDVSDLVAAGVVDLPKDI